MILHPTRNDPAPRAPLFVLVLLAATVAAGPSSGQTSLCEPDEETLWWCSAGPKTYSVCTSSDLDASSGYMQYRAAKGSEIEFRHPEDRRHPKGVFVFSMIRNGTTLEFENEGYRYVVYEFVKGRARIDVSKGGKELASIECDTSSDTLTLTTTIDRMEEVGINDR